MLAPQLYRHAVKRSYSHRTKGDTSTKSELNDSGIEDESPRSSIGSLSDLNVSDNSSLLGFGLDVGSPPDSPLRKSPKRNARFRLTAAAKLRFEGEESFNSSQSSIFRFNEDDEEELALKKDVPQSSSLDLHIPTQDFSRILNLNVESLGSSEEKCDKHEGKAVIDTNHRGPFHGDYCSCRQKIKKGCGLPQDVHHSCTSFHSWLDNNGGLSSRVIGRHMGKANLDVVTELSPSFIMVTRRIFSLLGGKDLLSCHEVSQSWQAAVRSDPVANKRRLRYLRDRICRSRQQGKENSLRQEAQLVEAFESHVRLASVRLTKAPGTLTAVQTRAVKVSKRTRSSPRLQAAPASATSAQESRGAPASDDKGAEPTNHQESPKASTSGKPPCVTKKTSPQKGNPAPKPPVKVSKRRESPKKPQSPLKNLRYSPRKSMFGARLSPRKLVASKVAGVSRSACRSMTFGKAQGNTKPKSPSKVVGSKKSKAFLKRLS